MRSPQAMHYWVIFTAFCLGFVAILCGVGGDDPSRVSVAGKVLLDGKPLESGTIRFLSKSSFPQAHVGVSLVEDGGYSITKTGSLIPGIYEVQIRSYAQEPKPSEIKKDADTVPPSERPRVSPRYNDQSVLEVNIGHGGLSKFDFDLNN